MLKCRVERLVAGRSGENPKMRMKVMEKTES